MPVIEGVDFPNVPRQQGPSPAPAPAPWNWWEQPRTTPPAPTPRRVVRVYRQGRRPAVAPAPQQRPAAPPPPPPPPPAPVYAPRTSFADQWREQTLQRVMPQKPSSVTFTSFSARPRYVSSVSEAIQVGQRQGQDFLSGFDAPDWLPDWLEGGLQQGVNWLADEVKRHEQWTQERATADDERRISEVQALEAAGKWAEVGKRIGFGDTNRLAKEMGMAFSGFTPAVSEWRTWRMRQPDGGYIVPPNERVLQVENAYRRVYGLPELAVSVPPPVDVKLANDAAAAVQRWSQGKGAFGSNLALASQDVQNAFKNQGTLTGIMSIAGVPYTTMVEPFVADWYQNVWTPYKQAFSATMDNALVQLPQQGLEWARKISAAGEAADATFIRLFAKAPQYATAEEVQKWRMIAPWYTQLGFGLVGDPLNVVGWGMTKAARSASLRRAARYTAPLAETVETVGKSMMSPYTPGWTDKLPFMGVTADSKAAGLIDTAIDTVNVMKNIVPVPPGQTPGQALLPVFAQWIMNPDDPALVARTGGFSASLPSKQTVSLVREMIGTTDGAPNLQNLERIIDVSGNDVEAVAKLAQRFDDASRVWFPEAKPGDITRIRNATYKILNAAYIGWNPGILGPNIMTNMMSTLMDGWNPFSRSSVRARWWKEYGPMPVAGKQGVGIGGEVWKSGRKTTQYLGSLTKPSRVRDMWRPLFKEGGWKLPIATLNSEIESAFSERTLWDALQWAYDGQWRRSLDGLEPALVPIVGERDARLLARRLRRTLNPEQANKVLDDYIRQAPPRGGGGGGAAAVPPAAAPGPAPIAPLAGPEFPPGPGTFPSEVAQQLDDILPGSGGRIADAIENTPPAGHQKAIDAALVPVEMDAEIANAERQLTDWVETMPETAAIGAGATREAVEQAARDTIRHLDEVEAILNEQIIARERELSKIIDAANAGLDREVVSQHWAEFWDKSRQEMFKTFGLGQAAIEEFVDRAKLGAPGERLVKNYRMWFDDTWETWETYRKRLVETWRQSEELRAVKATSAAHGQSLRDARNQLWREFRTWRQEHWNAYQARRNQYALERTSITMDVMDEIAKRYQPPPPPPPPSDGGGGAAVAIRPEAPRAGPGGVMPEAPRPAPPPPIEPLTWEQRVATAKQRLRRDVLLTQKQRDLLALEEPGAIVWWYEEGPRGSYRISEQQFKEFRTAARRNGKRLAPQPAPRAHAADVSPPAPAPAASPVAPVVVAERNLDDAVEALGALGFNKAEARARLAGLPDDVTDVESQVRYALSGKTEAPPPAAEPTNVLFNKELHDEATREISDVTAGALERYLGEEAPPPAAVPEAPPAVARVRYTENTRQVRDEINALAKEAGLPTATKDGRPLYVVMRNEIKKYIPDATLPVKGNIDPLTTLTPDQLGRLADRLEQRAADLAKVKEIPEINLADAFRDMEEAAVEGEIMANAKWKPGDSVMYGGRKYKVAEIMGADIETEMPLYKLEGYPSAVREEHVSKVRRGFREAPAATAKWNPGDSVVYESWNYKIAEVAGADTDGTPLYRLEIYPRLVREDRLKVIEKSRDIPASVWYEDVAKKAPPAPKVGVAGRPTKAFGIKDASQRYQMQYELVSLDDLTPSHLDDLETLNPVYDPKLQERVRSRLASKDQIYDMAHRMDWERMYTDVRAIDRGTPILGPADNMVESGNGRVLAMRQVRDNLPESWEAGQDWLRSHAEEYGLKPSDLDDIKDPVLVRRRTEDIDRYEFAADANARDKLAMSPYEQAASWAKSFGNDQLLPLFQVSEDQTVYGALAAERNRALRMAFLDNLSKEDRAAFLMAGGELNQDGLKALKNTLFATIYPGPEGERLALRLTEDLSETGKAIESAIYGSLSDAALTKRRIAEASLDPMYDATEPIARAANQFLDLRAEGRNVRQYIYEWDKPPVDEVGTVSMFPSTNKPPEEYLDLLDEFSRKPAQLRKIVKDYYATVNRLPVAESLAPQMDLGGVPRIEIPGPAEIMDEVAQDVRIHGIKGPPKETQERMLEFAVPVAPVKVVSRKVRNPRAPGFQNHPYSPDPYDSLSGFRKLQARTRQWLADPFYQNRSRQVVDEGALRQLWTDEVLPRQARSKATANRFATEERHFAYGNYAKQRDIHEMLRWAYMYPTFYGFSGRNWAIRAAKNPAIPANYARFRRLVWDQNQQEYRNEVGDPNAQMPASWDGYVKFPFFGGDAYARVERLLNPLYSMYYDYSNRARREAPGGGVVEALSGWGPGLYSPLLWAYAAALKAAGYEEAAQQWVGYIFPQSRAIKAGTALLREAVPSTASVIPPGGVNVEQLWNPNVRGGDIYERSQIAYFLWDMWRKGEISEREFQDTSYRQSGPAWERARQLQAAGRAPGTLMSFFTGLGFRRRDEMDFMLSRMYEQMNGVYALRNQVNAEAYRAAWDKFDRQYPYASAIRMARTFDDSERLNDYTWMVLRRYGPGWKKQTFLNEIDPGNLVGKFYRTGGIRWDGTEPWTQAEVDNLEVVIAEMARRMDVPTPDQVEDWDQAKYAEQQIDRRALDAINSSPGGTRYTLEEMQDMQREYYRLEEIDPVAAKLYLRQHPELTQWWDAQNQLQKQLDAGKWMVMDPYTTLLPPQLQGAYAAVMARQYQEAAKLNRSPTEAAFNEGLILPGDNWRQELIALGIAIPAAFWNLQDYEWRSRASQADIELAAKDVEAWLQTLPQAFRDKWLNSENMRVAKEADKRLKEQILPGLFGQQFVDWYYSAYVKMTPDERKAFRNANPDVAEKLSAMYDLMNQYGKENPMWALYYGMLEAAAGGGAGAGRGAGRSSGRRYYPRSSRRYYRRSYYGGGGGGGYGGGVFPGATPTTTTPTLGTFPTATPISLEQYNQLLTNARSDPSFDPLAKLLFGSDIFNLADQWYTLTQEADKLAWAQYDEQRWQRLIRFLQWLASGGSQNATIGLQSAPPGTGSPAVGLSVPSPLPSR